MIRRILLVIFVLILLPVTLLEYFTLVWIWASNSFTLVVTPIILLLCLACSKLLSNKFEEKKAAKTGIFISSLLFSPILTMILVFGLARVFQFEILIQ